MPWRRRCIAAEDGYQNHSLSIGLLIVLGLDGKEGSTVITMNQCQKITMCVDR